MELDNKYDYAKNNKSDINEHIETLYKYTLECSSVAEAGVRGMVSTWAFLKGLRDSGNQNLKYYGFDIIPLETTTIDRICFENQIDNTSHFGMNDLEVDITNENYDLLFIDTAHNYCHCLEELNKFHSHVNKYIILHDTTIDGETSEYVRFEYDTHHYAQIIPLYNNKYTEDDFKKGILYAIGEFLEDHPEWEIYESYDNNNGLTVLRKI